LDCQRHYHHPNIPQQNLPKALVATAAALCGGKIQAKCDMAGFNLFQSLILALILPPPLQSSSDLYYSLRWHSETVTVMVILQNLRYLLFQEGFVFFAN